ncbi:WXG100 family type VII secretion target [Nocardia sp. NPDC005978]|uniref:WXG100 family type VII secretion target n=1 Tax=Nocardia sp. NPDC005978 TaxID=3156725 RepID=UPI0033B79A74
MGQEVLSVTPPELTAAATAIRSLLEGISKEYRSLDSDADNLSEGWIGYQGGLFTEGWSDIQEGLSALFDALEQMTTALDDGAEEYLKQEQVSTESIDFIRLSLDL